MDEVLARKTIGEHRYEVFYDNFDNLDYMDFENENDRIEYLEKFERGELSSFGVVKSRVCECCCMWSEVDSLWSIHCETPDEALELYFEEYKEITCTI